MSVSLSALGQKTLAQLFIHREVAHVADSEAFYAGARSVGQDLKDADLETRQVRALENLACSTAMVSDLYDFIKRQIGRRKWAAGVGKKLLEALEGLRNDAGRIVQAARAQYPGGVDDDTARHVHLMLCREYLKHVVAHYLYVRREARS